MPTTKPKPETVGIAPATLRGLHRKKDLTLDEILMLPPGSYRFLFQGPFGKANERAVNIALAFRAAAKK